MTVNSYNTAIKRSTPSLPLRGVLSKYFRDDYSALNNKIILDYGCGRGFDADFLEEMGVNVDSYDPHWKPDGIKVGHYDFIFCTYVLNVLDGEESSLVIDNIKDILSDDGVAFISVRRDIRNNGKTSRGYQRNVDLNLEKLCEYKGKYCTYLLRRQNERQ